MKTNFNIKRKEESQTNIISEDNENPQKNLTQSEFEEFISKSGAAGSFMIYRSDKKEDELGLDEL